MNQLFQIFNIDEVEATKISASNLNLICKNILQQTVTEIIETRKLIEAKNQLTHSDKNISEIGFDWAIEANEKMKKSILEGNHKKLINFRSQGKAFDTAIPAPEQYLPLLYSLALQGKNEEVILFNDKAVAGALTMTSVRIG